ncbi:ABC transporter B family member 26, chloroplastic-like isoform X2 [Gastrolobium bilobum]|uniref:ABC transporter B family member 26, chloroplastic-like isoform X2 n=1 Tax=Gastrolobium bilobum TaxID=150636 RepID=UPI002AB06CAB|nr:ABC transporter B family member 26, chloroplastic-like isoform X2 [Gastrolobium bilobum]
MSPNLCVSHIPKWNTFYNKPQTHFLFGRSKSFRVVTPETRFRLAVSENEEAVSGFQKLLGKRVGFVASILPGGSWWTLSEHREEDAEQPTAVMLALRRMWELVADKRWVAIVAFGSLAVAALSEITMPSILAASIFSAESGETVAFSRNAFFLVLLCFTSGICRLAADCQRLSHVIGNDLHLILRNTLQGTGAIINLLTLSWPLASSALVICSMLSAIFVVYGQYQRKAAKLTQDFTACANDVAQETISSIRIVRAYGAGKKEFGRYKQWLQRLAYINRRESVAYGFWNLSFNTLYRSTQIFAVLLGGMSVLGCCVTVEQLTKYVLYCEWLIYATWRVTNSLSSLLQSIGASEKTFQLMNLLPSDQFLAKGVKLQRLMGHIQFVNVSFHYPARMMMPVLEHLNFTVEANQVIAIVGLSGSGKSTLLNLLLRLYEPSSGQIYIDGFPLTELDIRWLRQNIGYVAQEPHLFNMDIKSNIEYGCPRKIKQEDIELAAKQASAHDFISSLPNGYETLVDDNALSGGQKQRIAIARAILRDPVIMILDEATSALDAESEHDIKEVLYALKDESKSRTIIIIAHRLSTIKAADRIFVMDDGRIIEMGNHDELLLKDGLYAKLNKIQTDILT